MLTLIKSLGIILLVGCEGNYAQDLTKAKGHMAPWSSG